MSASGIRQNGDFFDRTLAAADSMATDRKGFNPLSAGAPTGTPYRFLLSPIGVRAEGATSFGLSGGFFSLVSGDRLAFLQAGYNRTILDETGGADTFSGGLLVTVVSPTDNLIHKALPTSAELTAVVKRRLDTSTSIGVELATTQAIYVNNESQRQLDVSAGIGYSTKRLDDSDSLSDLTYGGGLRFAVNSRTYFKFDYVFENDVAGGDDYALSFSQVVSGNTFPGRARVTFSVRKDMIAMLGINMFLR